MEPGLIKRFAIFGSGMPGIIRKLATALWCYWKERCCWVMLECRDLIGSVETLDDVQRLGFISKCGVVGYCIVGRSSIVGQCSWLNAGCLENCCKIASVTMKGYNVTHRSLASSQVLSFTPEPNSTCLLLPPFKQSIPLQSRSRANTVPMEMSRSRTSEKLPLNLLDFSNWLKLFVSGAKAPSRGVT